jgi:hypothetical protein
MPPVTSASPRLTPLRSEQLEYDSPWPLEDPEDRFRWAVEADISSYWLGVLSLNKALIPDTPYNDHRIGLITTKSTFPDGTTSTMGLDYRSDFAGYLFDYLKVRSSEVVAAPLSRSEKLQRLGHMAAVLIAQGQPFSIGNKRTARALYGLITQGTAGIVPAYNAQMSFEPPQELEDLILFQNLSRLSAPSHDGDVQAPLGGCYVEGAVSERIIPLRAKLAAIRQNATLPKHLSAVWDQQRYALRQLFETSATDKSQQQKLTAALMQAKYGPAAYSLACQSSDELDAMDADKAQNIIETNNTLLRMRLMSLLSGLASGGIFVAIEGALPEDAVARRVEKIRWQPKTPYPQIETTP